MFIGGGDDDDNNGDIMYNNNNNNNNKTMTAAAATTMSTPSFWTRFEDKMFEHLLVMFPEGTTERWQKIAEKLPGKTASLVRDHYEDLVYDVAQIDSGLVELPSYVEDSPSWESQISFGSPNKHSKNESERKKGTPWTADEHKLFLLGLQTYGKGDWRSISRNFVLTRTPTQVASHAQKFYLRQSSVKKERKRSSIHDITAVEEDEQIPVPPPNDYSDHQGSSMGYQNFDFHQ